MKGIKKFVVSALAVCLVLLATLTDVAAVKVKEGTTKATATYTYSGYNGVDVREVTFDNFITGATITNVKTSGPAAGSFTGSGLIYNTTDPAKTISVTVTLSVTLSNSAKAGDKAYVYLTGDLTNKEGKPVYDQTAKVLVEITEATSGTTEPDKKIDYTELKKQIAIAEGLNKSEYTSDSWANLVDALANGKAHLTSKSQSAVDTAAKELADAIAALVKMDYSRLQEALNQSRDLIDSDEAGKLWEKLVNAMTTGKGLLGSNDQAAVDAAADELFALIEEIKAFLEEQLGVTIVGEGEEFCNIPLHKLWPILFFISLAVNVVLGYMLVRSKKKNFNDNTPVVDYNISDDDK